MRSSIGGIFALSFAISVYLLAGLHGNVPEAVGAGTYQKTFGINHPSWSEAHVRNVYLSAEIKKHMKPVASIFAPPQIVQTVQKAPGT